MKKLLIRIASWLISQGADKWLHVIAGIVIAELIMLLPMTIGAKCIASFIGVTIVEFCKENLVDSKLDWNDVLATIVGCCIGILLSYLNIICA